MQAEAAGGKVSGPLALWAGLVTLVPPHGAGAPAVPSAHTHTHTHTGVFVLRCFSVWGP